MKNEQPRRRVGNFQSYSLGGLPGRKPAAAKLAKLSRLARPGSSARKRALRLSSRRLQETAGGGDTLVDRIAAMDTAEHARKRCPPTRVVPPSDERIRAFSSPMASTSG